MSGIINAINTYNFKSSNTNTSKIENLGEYKTYKEFLFGTDKKLNYGDKQYLNGYIDAMQNMSTYLGEGMFIMTDTLINENISKLIDKIGNLDEKLSGKMDYQFETLNNKIENLNNKVDDKITKLDEKLSGKIDNMDEKINDNFNFLKDTIHSIDTRLTTIETVNNIDAINNRTKDDRRFAIKVAIVSSLLGITLASIVVFAIDKWLTFAK